MSYGPDPDAHWWERLAIIVSLAAPGLVLAVYDRYDRWRTRP